jgi:beta-glucanase (GH16 family)
MLSTTMIRPASSPLKPLLLIVLAAVSMRCQVNKRGLAVPSGEGGAGGEGTGGAIDTTGADAQTDGPQGSGGAQGSPDAWLGADSQASATDGNAFNAAEVPVAEGPTGLGGTAGTGGLDGGPTTTSTGGAGASGGSTGPRFSADASSSEPTLPIGPDSRVTDEPFQVGLDDGPASGPDLLEDGPPEVGVDLLEDAGHDSSPDRPAPPADLVDTAPPSPDTAPDAPADSGPKLTLLWRDEFDGDLNSGVDLTKWSYANWPARTVNNEEQQYTDRRQNVFLDGDGHLVLRALISSSQSAKYTSGRIDTSGKLPVKNGRIEVRAKLPAGRGSFPGIVMLGTGGTWPQAGEIALMEQNGQPKDKGSVYVSAYADGSPGSGDREKVSYTFLETAAPSTDFHVYSVDWYTDHLVFQVDGNEVMRTSFDSSSPFYTTPEYIVLNLAIGGTFGGTVDPNAFPMDMLVDYVRVYSF